MNASQRRIFRRALSTATGIVSGSTVRKGATVGTVERVSPNGTRSVLVKRRDNRRVVWLLGDLTPFAA